MEYCFARRRQRTRSSNFGEEAIVAFEGITSAIISKRAELRQDKIARRRLDIEARLQNYLAGQRSTSWRTQLKQRFRQKRLWRRAGSAGSSRSSPYCAARSASCG